MSEVVELVLDELDMDKLEKILKELEHEEFISIYLRKDKPHMATSK